MKGEFTLALELSGEVLDELPEADVEDVDMALGVDWYIELILFIISPDLIGDKAWALSVHIQPHGRYRARRVLDGRRPEG